MCSLAPPPGQHATVESIKLVLRKLQNRAAKIIINSYYDASAFPLLSILQWLSIDGIINRETITMVYKPIDNLVLIYLCNLFTKNSSRHIVTLRNSYTDLYVLFMNTKNVQTSFSYRFALFWSGLKPTSLN